MTSTSCRGIGAELYSTPPGVRNPMAALRIERTRASRDKPQALSRGCGLDPRADVELAEDARDVNARRLLCHVEPLPDLAVGHALGEQLQHLEFARGEAEVIGHAGLPVRGGRGLHRQP